MKFKKRSLISLMLVISMLAAAGCSSNNAVETADTTQVSAEVTETETETEDPLADNLPETDMEGWTFRMAIFGNANIRSYAYAEELNGNVVNDAVHTKITNVEDRFNTDIVLTEACLNDKNDQAVLIKSIIAGEDSCEIGQGHDISMANASLEGYFLNVYDIPHLDFEKPWWMPATLESMTILDQMYLMFNNISYQNLMDTRVMYFNKNLMDDMGMEYPYETVYEGKWTMDELVKLSDSAYIDLNGDGKSDKNDQFGFICPGYFYACMEPFKVEPYCKDENGALYYDLDVERVSSLVEKYYNLLFGVGGLKSDYATCNKIFTENRALFYYENLDTAVPDFADSEVVFGILPMPKLDESQDQYYGGATDRPIAVPITVQKENMDNIGIVTEALNAEGYKNVYPAFFEVAMKSRYADQSDDAKMLDIIHDNVIISFTYLFGDFNSAYNVLLGDMLNKSSADVASWDAKKTASETKRVEKLMAFFSEHQNP